MNFWSDPEETTLVQRFLKLIFQIKSQKSFKTKESLKLLRKDGERSKDGKSKPISINSCRDVIPNTDGSRFKAPTEEAEGNLSQRKLTVR